MPRIVGEWTKDKLMILSLYLRGYLGATTSALERIYIDAFAGPGNNAVRRSREIIDGSPLIALAARAQNGTKFSRLFFIEQDPGLVAELRDKVSALGEANRCEVIEGDVDDELPKLMRRLPRRSPTFVLLDTQGIDPRWTTIQAIAPWRVEFLINFPLGMSINRNPQSDKALAYFGTRECLPLLRSRASGRTRALLDLYKTQLANVGLTYTTTDDRLVKTENNQRLYYLVFASKVEIGTRIMDWVFNQPDYRGQKRLL